MIFNNTSQIEKYLSKHIPKNPEKNRDGMGLKKVKIVLEKIGDPQNKLKIIHIAGTSGKGSTANFISKILASLGFKVGLHVSPHLLDVRERFQINNHLINRQKFCKYFNKLHHLMEKVDSGYDKLTYFEILTIFSFYVFSQENVSYAIIETGLGGLYDATNAVTSTNKIVVLTKIGLDHTTILGKTIAKIAYQKAMIIQNRNTVISIWQRKSAEQIIEKIIRKKEAKLFYVKKKVNYFNLQQKIDKTIFNFRFSDFYLKNIELSIIGLHQVENCSLALVTILLLAKRDKFICQPSKIRNSLKKIAFPGRMEFKKIQDKVIILDGAHNPQKLSSLVKCLKAIFPDGKRFNFLIAFKKGKNIYSMVNQIKPIAKTVVITNFYQINQDMINASEEPARVASYFKKNNFNNYRIIPNPKKAVDFLIKDKDNIFIITGSLYLISETYSIIKNYENKN